MDRRNAGCGILREITFATYVILPDDSDRYVVQMPKDLIPRGHDLRLGVMGFLNYRDKTVTSSLRRSEKGSCLTDSRRHFFADGLEYECNVTVKIFTEGDYPIVTAVDEQEIHYNEPSPTDPAEEMRRAIVHNKIEIWEALLAQGVNVKAGDTDGLTALHCAAAATWDCKEDSGMREEEHVGLVERRVKLVNQLFDAGADADKKGFEGWTPLHDAACNWNPEIAELIIRRGASLTVTNDLGETPLHVAVSFQKLGSVKVFLDAKADVGVQNLGGDTVLHVATSRRDVKAVKLLLAAGAEINAKDAGGKTVLHDAVLRGDIDMVNLLLAAGAEVNATDEAGNTASHYAADLPNPFADVIPALQEAGADFAVQNHKGQTPLHRAICNKCSSKTVKALTNDSAVTLRDVNNDTPLDIAAKKIPAGGETELMITILAGLKDRAGRRTL